MFTLTVWSHGPAKIGVILQIRMFLLDEMAVFDREIGDGEENGLKRSFPI